jgi:N-acetylmuramic acid 6-phosphate etherase
VGVIAGGDSALRISSEGKEDDASGAWEELKALKLNDLDTVIAIAAGGTTPFALGALTFAKEHSGSSPTTAMICCATIEKPRDCDHLIMLRTGPEVLTGSTRMKAGTATKLTLNAISTTLLIRAGHVYQNLMVGLKASNDKLRDRAARIVATLTGLARERAFEVLDAAGGDVKIAVLMHSLGVDASTARARLAAAHDRLGDVLPAHNPFNNPSMRATNHGDDDFVDGEDQ